ncbi:MAG: response regulator transcription factor [Candidatus Acidiferrales bacterium]
MRQVPTAKSNVRRFSRREGHSGCAATIRAIVADDYTVVRDGMAAILNRQMPNLSVVGQARTWTEAIATAGQHSPDIALLDVRMPGMEAAEGVAILRREHPELHIVLMSAFDCDEDIYGVIRAGANGFILKDFKPAEILACVRAVLQGKRWLPAGPAQKLSQRLNSPELTLRQIQILQTVTLGKTNKEVGATLGITEGTVKVQMNHIFRKLGASNRTEAITKALQRGLVRLRPQT